MKKLLYIFLGLSLIVACSDDDKKNDLTRNNLNGNVKSTYEISFEAIEKFGEIEKGDKRWQDYDESDNKLIYNDNGNRIEDNKYDKDGELTNKLKFKYDDNGNQIEEKNYDEDGELENKYIYEYKFDDKENWIQKTIFKDDKPTFIIEREIKYYD